MATARFSEDRLVFTIHLPRMTAPAGVQSRDFLHKYVETPLHEQYIAAGALCRLSTNSDAVLQAARQTFAQIQGEPSPPRTDFSLRLWVDERDHAQPPWPKPYLRGCGHLVYMGLDGKSSILADLARQRLFGRVSSGIASDAKHWRATIFPMLMSIVAGSVGLVELHASCVANQSGAGLLLLGQGRSGKSTLAKAMLNAGFRVLSDDRIFCSVQDDRLRAYGLPRPIKLRQDAGAWFGEYRDLTPTHMQNGEPVFHCNSSTLKGLPCEPAVIVCLERIGEGFCISRMKRSELKQLIESDLLPESPDSIDEQMKVIDRLAELPCWRLQYGARPEIVVEYLSKLLSRHTPAATD